MLDTMAEMLCIMSVNKKLSVNQTMTVCCACLLSWVLRQCLIMQPRLASNFQSSC